MRMVWKILPRIKLESIVRNVRIFRQDIGMEFGIEKCAVLIINKGKWQTARKCQNIWSERKL